MVKEKETLGTYEEKRAQVQEFNLTSDLFACKVFEDVDACRELCEILLHDRTIVLHSVRTQYVIRNLETHSIELDILAERDNGDVIGVEIQMYDEKAPFKRTRYYLSSIDMSILGKGKDYDELPAVTMVYLTKKDIIGDGIGYCVIERRADCQGQSGRPKDTKDISNGIKEWYYNLEYPAGDDKVDELLGYFKDSDPYYKTKNFPRIVERVKYLKIRKEGVDIMCEIADRIRNEGREEGMLEGMVKAIIDLLEELGHVPQRIEAVIRAEDSLNVLSRWLKTAARVSSITEFEAKM